MDKLDWTDRLVSTYSLCKDFPRDIRMLISSGVGIS